MSFSLSLETWDITYADVSSARPFVVQHALKDLLLVAPVERFQGFARLLGLNDVDSIQQAIVNLCTKPEANLSDKAKRFLNEQVLLEERLAAISGLQSIGKDLKRGLPSIEQAFKKALKRAEVLLGKKQKLESVVKDLKTARDEAAAKVYAGTVEITALTSSDQIRLSSNRQKISDAVDETFIKAYARLAARDATERLQKQADLLALGIDLIKTTPETCPLCGQSLDDTLRAHIHERHETTKEKLGTGSEPQDPRAHVTRQLSELDRAIADHRLQIDNRCSGLLSATKAENQTKVQALFGRENKASWEIVRSTAIAVEACQDAVQSAVAAAKNETDNCRAALQAHNEEISQAENLGRVIQQYIVASDALSNKLDEVTLVLSGPALLLRQAIDAAAGTTELSLLMEMFEGRPTIEKILRVRGILESTKELKKHVDQTVGEVMEAAFGTDLTGSVMNWYDKIRTSGDPDVHFSGFAMEKTKGGDFKSRRVKVAAKSYGVELASAVSSLSESKLNALGLCMSIATAVRAPGPWSFLLLDDPIQSWDADHETQFINVIRSLAEQQNKQVILFSHRNDWIDQVSYGCRTINGARYCITGYTKDGPHITSVEWSSIDHRLKEALSISNNPSATPVNLQQAEEEIRIVAGQITAGIAKVKLSRERGAHNMNSADARSILVEAGCPAELLDRVIASFGTTDKAHHAPKGYQINSERIRQYHGALIELKRWAGI
jgi:hypothetical protein